MSTIEANTLKPISGSSTLTLGESGDTVSLGTGVTAGTGIGTTINNNADNRVITGSGTANTLEGESTLTYNGSDLGVGIATPTFSNGNGLHLNSVSDNLRLHLTNTATGTASGDGADIAVGSDSALNIIQKENAIMRFYTNNISGMELDSGQRLSFGKDAVSTPRLHYPNNDPQFVTKVGSTSSRTAFLFNNPNGTVGDIATSGSSTSYNTSSDYRLKENVSDMTGAINRVKQLQPKRFNFIADETDTLVDGFIAHEVSDVVPEAITGTKDGMAKIYYQEDDEIPNGKQVGDFKEYSTTEIQPQAIDQSKLVPLLTSALQEAITKIETLEARVQALESA